VVDVATFNRLSSEEQNEYQQHAGKFVRAVLKSGAQDGYDFEEKYPIQNINGKWCLAKLGSTNAFSGIKSNSKAVIEALLTDAVQNYGR